VNLEEFKNFSVKNNTFLLEGEISTKKLREEWKKKSILRKKFFVYFWKLAIIQK